jgi:integrase
VNTSNWGYLWGYVVKTLKVIPQMANLAPQSDSKATGNTDPASKRPKNLNDKAIQSLKRRASPYKTSDSKVKGLFILVTKSGSKLWRLKYRFDKKEKSLSFGLYPAVGLEDARTKANEARSLLAKGIDPSASKQNDERTFERYANTWLQGMKKETGNAKGWVPAHHARQVARLEQHVYPTLGKHLLTEIKPTAILNLCIKIAEKKGRDDSPTIETARRVLFLIGQIFSDALIEEHVTSNPTTGLSKSKKLLNAEEKHHAAVTEPKALGSLLRSLHGYSGGVVVQSALKLMPLLFVRPGELRQAKWADVNFESKEWRFKPSKGRKANKTNEDHIVPLATQAIQILRDLQQITSGEVFVFPSLRSGNRPMSDNAVLAAMRSMGIGREVTSGHGFRATARTILDEVLSQRVEWIELQLAHLVKDANGTAYNRTTFLPHRHKMMQTWADYLDSLRNSNIFEFSKAA